MKMTYTTASGRLRFEMDATDRKQAFEIVAAIQEIFEEPCCGKCKSPNIRHSVRDHDGNKYYKMQCMACGAQLDFGQHKVGNGLFVKRKDKDGNFIPGNGWYVWSRDQDGEYQQPAPQPAPPAGRATNQPQQAPQRQAPPPQPSGGRSDDPIPF